MDLTKSTLRFLLCCVSHSPCVWQLVSAHLWQLTLAHPLVSYVNDPGSQPGRGAGEWWLEPFPAPVITSLTSLPCLQRSPEAIRIRSILDNSIK